MSDKKSITVIGGINIDVSAALSFPFVRGDSIPGSVTTACGGVAHNIAYNLALLGNDVKFITVFGDDFFGEYSRRHCEKTGLDISCATTASEMRNGVYLCINDTRGDMIIAVNDTKVIETLAPEYLLTVIDDINRSQFIIADTNIPGTSLRFLIDNARIPLAIDGVSINKARRIVNALHDSKRRQLHTLKLNLLEAREVTGHENVHAAAAELLAMGVQNLFITLGKNGVLCTDGTVKETLPAIPVEVVNTTGAGDAFLAGAVHAFAAGHDIVGAAQFALHAARATLRSPEAVNPNLMQEMYII